MYSFHRDKSKAANTSGDQICSFYLIISFRAGQIDQEWNWHGRKEFIHPLVALENSGCSQVEGLIKADSACSFGKTEPVAAVMQTTQITWAIHGKFCLQNRWKPGSEESSKNHLIKSSDGTAFLCAVIRRGCSHKLIPAVDIDIEPDYLPLLHHSILGQMFLFALLPPPNIVPLFHKNTISQVSKS